MKRSTDRILVSHVGSLVRPMSIRDILFARDHGQPYDEATYQKILREEVAGVVRKQADVGIDIVSDGEYGKAGWIRYVSERLGDFAPPAYLVRDNDRAHGHIFMASGQGDGHSRPPDSTEVAVAEPLR
jgi:methionine synthase II (cobalamin-independent)